MPLAERMARLIVARACAVLCASALLSLLAGAAGIAIIRADNQRLRQTSAVFAPSTAYDWSVDSLQQKQADMVESALDVALPVSEEGTVVRERSEKADEYTRLSFAYFSRSGGNVFTPASLQQICEIENVLLQVPGYEKFCYLGSPTVNGTSQCANSESVVTLFYPPQQSLVRNCTLLDTADVEASAANIYRKANSSDLSVQRTFGFYVSVSTFDTTPPASKATRTGISFGMPLAGYTSAQDRDDEQNDKIEDFIVEAETALMEYFGMKKSFFRSAYRSRAVTPDLDVRFYSRPALSAEFGRLIGDDLLAVIASIFFVALYIGLYTGSFTLGALGICLILLSFPIAMFVFTVIRVNWFGSFHILALFVVLGVGADDIFVFQDAWRHSAHISSVSTSIERRMVYTLSHTMSAVFNTSFTTSVAFLATALSPIMPISSFGIFAAIAIVANFLLVITFWPAVVVIWEVRFNRASCVGCCFPCIPACRVSGRPKLEIREPEGMRTSATAEKEASLISEMLNESHTTNLGHVERFFSRYFAPAITYKSKSIGGLKPVSVLLIVCLGTLGIVLSTEALQMSPPVEEEQWFPSDHMLHDLTSLLQDSFISGPSDSYVSGGLYLGLSGLDRNNFNHWVPDKNRGDVIFDDAFNMTTAESHAAFLALCASLRAAPCGLEGCERPPYTLVLPESVECFLEDFASDVGTPLPTGAAFTAQLKQWLLGSGRKHISNVGWIGDAVKFVRIEFETTMRLRQPNDIVNPIYDKFIDLIDDFLATAPSTMSTCFPYAGRAFTWMVTELKLVEGVFIGFAICFPVAFVVLFIATANLLMSIYAVLTIALVVGSLLGFTRVAMGWSLGTGESIAATIVLGLAVDYTVHLGHIISKSEQTTREGKVVHAASFMGGTVFAGSTTTLGSALFMFACQLTFFSKMAVLISGTVILSLGFALLFFLPVCAVIGPSGPPRKWTNYCKKEARAVHE